MLNPLSTADRSTPSLSSALWRRPQSPLPMLPMLPASFTVRALPTRCSAASSPEPWPGTLRGDRE